MTLTPAIVSAESNGEREDWYFSCTMDGSLTLTGHRLYRKNESGDWYIAKRWYPDNLALVNMIELIDVPLPDDVAREAISESSGLAYIKAITVTRDNSRVVVVPEA